ncbi:DUF4345 domain-containing protein [Methylomonas sp. MgM2]
MKIRKAFLIFAFAMVSIIALLYGVSPQWFTRTFLDMPQLDPNIAHILRAVMGLYLALGIFWLYAAFNDQYRNIAVLTTAIFAGGLVLGRILSFFIEGQPAPLLIFYIGAEFLLTPIALWIFCLDD